MAHRDLKEELQLSKTNRQVSHGDKGLILQSGWQSGLSLAHPLSTCLTGNTGLILWIVMGLTMHIERGDVYSLE